MVYAVTGLPGAGKTQIAAAYARECVNEGWRLIAWVNAETLPETLAGLALVAARLGIAADGLDADAAGQRVRNWLEADGERCLVVFDNVTNIAALRQYVPAAGRCQVVLTSTSESTASLGSPVPVEAFTRSESLAYLAARTRLTDTGGPRELSDARGGRHRR